VRQTNDFEERVRSLIQSSIAVKQELLQDVELVASVAEVSKLIVAALMQGHKILLLGNGGSAADAQHIAAEFVGRFAFDRPALPALALSVNTSCVTAIGNDYGFDLVFSRQIEALGQKGDVAIGISTSGNSANVLHAMSTSRKMGLYTVALTGDTGGSLKGAVDHCLCVPSTETARIQECHILIGHIICELVERTIFREQRGISGPLAVELQN
jgi:D-sedoheptulose 7-phosphate isomerase